MASGQVSPSERHAEPAHQGRGRDPPDHAARPLDRARAGRGRRRAASARRSAAPALQDDARTAACWQGDPGDDADGVATSLLDYRQLYALWERQNWRAHELDFTVDREQWVTTPREAQESTIWSLGSFYVGEERVTADLAPFLQAAPERRDRAVPRHPARGRGAPRRLLRPLRRRGDGLLGRRLPRPDARGRADPALALARGVRRRPARRRASASRRSRTTSTCSSRASRPTTWSSRASWP